MNIEAGFRLGAVFKCQVRKAKTNELVYETDEFKNIVLDAGLVQMGLGSWITMCCVGSGDSTPVETQTQLDNFIASTTAIASGAPDSGGVQITTLPYYWYGRRTWRFPVGSATGIISEVGLGWGNNTLWDRALIKNALGVPTPITVLEDEYLDIVSEVRVYPDEGTGVIKVVAKDGSDISTHNFLAKPIFRASDATFVANGAVTTIKGSVGSNNMQISSVATPASPATTVPAAIFGKRVGVVVRDTHSVKMEAVISSTEANNAPHKSFYFALGNLMCGNLATAMTGMCYAVEFDPPIPKTTANVLTYRFGVSWRNYVT